MHYADLPSVHIAAGGMLAGLRSIWITCLGDLVFSLPEATEL